MGLALGVLLAAGTARSADRPGARILLRTEGCTLDGPELERLVRLELSEVLSYEARTSLYEVTIACGPNGTRLRITDPLTAKALERGVVPPPPGAPEPERLVALAVAQLYRSSWLELLARERDPLAMPPQDGIRPPASVQPKAALAADHRISGDPHPVKGALLIAGGAIAYRLGGVPLVLPVVAIEGRVLPRATLWLAATVGAGAGTVHRVTGDVEVRGFRATSGIGVEPFAAGPIAGFARLDIGVEYVEFAGHPTAPGFVPGNVQGIGFFGAAGAGVALSLRSFRFELAPRVGLVAGTPQGSVARDKPVGVGGAWAGADLAVGVAF